MTGRVLKHIVAVKAWRVVAAAAVAAGLAASGSSVSHAAPPTLVSCGSTAATGASTTTVITVTGTVLVGNDLIVVLSDDGGAFGAISAVDSAGNPYATRQQATNSTPPPTVTTALMDSLAITAVPTTITVTHPSASARVARCFVNNGGSPMFFAATSSGTGENATPDTGLALSPATGLVVTSVVNRDDTAYTPSNGSYLDLGDVGTGSAGSDIVNHSHYLVTQTNGSYDGDGTLAVPQGWAALVVTYSYELDAAAELVDIRATRHGNSVRLDWTTLSEKGNVGFKVKREGFDGRLIDVTPRLVPSQGSALSGASYYFYDHSAPTGRARYWLVDIDVNGFAQRHGPLLVGPVLRGAVIGDPPPVAVPNDAPIAVYGELDAQSPVGEVVR